MKIGFNTRNLLTSQKEFSISDASDITQVPKPTLRYWEKEFAQYLKLKKTDGNQRRYSDENIHTIEEIKYLLNVDKFTIAGAKRRMKVLREEKQEFREVLKKAVEEIKKGKSINEVVNLMTRSK